jgi:coenzyme F420-reducing hydrogenase delta subunit/NAD-dependent dihydropyrimidine dehydrogenase PreA subunit
MEEEEIPGQTICVIICKCGKSIFDKIDLARLVESLRNDPLISKVSVLDEACSDDSREELKSVIKDGQIKRVVFVGCSPSFKGEFLRGVVEEAGVNSHLLEFVNVREQVAWVHSDPVKATNKAIKLARMAVEKVVLDEPLFTKEIDHLPDQVTNEVREAASKPALDPDEYLDLMERLRRFGISVVRPGTDSMEYRLIKEPTMVSIDDKLCGGCGVCVPLCPNEALKVRDDICQVDEMLCGGCGTCSAACPSGASYVKNKEDKRFYRMIDRAKDIGDDLDQGGSTEPKIIGFLCKWCSYKAADEAGNNRLIYPADFIPITVSCAGMVDPQYILYSLAKGVDGILITGCQLGECQYENGNYQVFSRLVQFKALLEQMGLNPARVSFAEISATEGERFAETVTRFVNDIKELGPNPAGGGGDE